MIRYLCNPEQIPKDWDVRNGPGIADASDLFFLQDEPWLELKMSSIAECKKDGVIPWVRSAARGALIEAEKQECKLAMGPNVCFYNEQVPESARPELTSRILHRMLMLNDINIQQAMEVVSEENRSKIRHVQHFLRPSLYKTPYHYKKKWDVLFLVRGGFQPPVRFKYTNHTALINGWYIFDELVYKAQRSEVCMTSCVYESYGCSVHEINALGCPVLHDERSLRTPNYCEGMSVPVETHEFTDMVEVEAAVERARAMDRKQVHETAMEFSSIERLKGKYRKALVE